MNMIKRVTMRAEHRAAPSSNPFATPRVQRDKVGFSLVEVLLAIFILGIGIIAIASLFPAGIAQQRRTVDDVMGPVVARNAVATLRSKLEPQMFGTFEQFGPLTSGGSTVPYRSPMPTEPGDWPWLRPAVVTEPGPFRGMIDIFSAIYIRNQILNDSIAGWANVAEATEFPEPGWNQFGAPGTPSRRVYGIPHTSPGGAPPAITFTQNERSYPMREGFDPSQIVGGGGPAGEQQGKPQYYWDCMFRRFDGRVQVAVFVYRVSFPPGVDTYWQFPANPSAPALTWLPFRFDPGSAPAEFSTTDEWDAVNYDPSTSQTNPNVPASDESNFNLVTGNKADEPIDPFDPQQSWQTSGQWLLDQNNRVYEVVSRFRGGNGDAETNPILVELTRPIAPVAGVNSMSGAPAGQPTHSPYYYFGNPGPNGFVYTDVVTSVWYMPRNIEYDADLDGDGEPDTTTTATITPVYLHIEEL